MKGFLIFIVLVAVICGAFYGGYVIIGRDRGEEVRMVGALKLAQQEVNKKVKAVESQLFSPDFQAVPNTSDRWALTGIATSTHATGERGEGPFTAILTNVCRQYDNPECWKISDLEVEQKIRAAKLEGEDDTAADGEDPEETAEASETDSQVESSDEAQTAAEAGKASDAADPAPKEEIAAQSGSENAEEDAAAAQEPPESVAQVVEKLPEVVVPDTSEAEAPEPDFSGLSREEIIKQVQASLAQLGYKPGPADGKIGPKTTAAIRAYQADQGLDTNGEATPVLLSQITKTLAAN